MEKSSGDAGAGDGDAGAGDGECKGFLLPGLWKSMKSYVERNGEAFAYYSAWRTSAQMLEDRNIYEIDSNSFDITYAQFLSKFNLTRTDKPRQPDLDALAIVANHKSKAAERIAELFVNVLRDTLKTEFKMTTTEEQEHVFKERIKTSKIPRKDWIARYFALQKGEIVKGTYTPHPDALKDVEDESESDERKDDCETCTFRTISHVGNASYYRLA